MSRRDDYSDEMFTKRLSDADVEAVLSGQSPDDPTLNELARALSALDPGRFEDATDEKAAVFAKQAAALARAGGPVELAATARFRRGLSLTPRLAPAAVAAILLFAMSGVAVASDSSVPGDALYGLDKALESIGIGNGGAAERIEEAKILTENGDSAAALDLLAESFDADSSQAADALHRAAERIRDNGGPNSEVAEMLDSMSQATSRGRDFAEVVTDHANNLGEGVEPEDRGQSGEAPGRTEETPGQGGESPSEGNQDQENQGQDNPGQDNPAQGNQGQGSSGSAPGQSKP